MKKNQTQLKRKTWEMPMNKSYLINFHRLILKWCLLLTTDLKWARVKLEHNVDMRQWPVSIGAKNKLKALNIGQKSLRSGPGAELKRYASRLIRPNNYNKYIRKLDFLEFQVLLQLMRVTHRLQLEALRFVAWDPSRANMQIQLRVN